MLLIERTRRKRMLTFHYSHFDLIALNLSEGIMGLSDKLLYSSDIYTPRPRIVDRIVDLKAAFRQKL